MKLLFFVLIVLVLNFTQSANSICDYASTKAWVQISNNASQSKTLYFGFDPIYATCFLLDSFQIELPPPPPANVFYSNFNFKCNTSEKLFECDYKHYVNQTQVDTYKIKIQSGDTGFPIKVHWSKANIQSICDSAILREIGGTQIVNMTSTDSMIITDDIISSIRIIRYGAKLNPVGVVSNNDVLPDKFILQQNYPNPFNHSSIINYQLSAGGFVILKVYDVMGQEAAILVNEYKQAGYYESSLEADRLSSGIYYYRMKVGNFIDTKKMILVK